MSPGRYIPSFPFFAQPGFLQSPSQDYRLPPQAYALANFQATYSAWDQPLQDRVPYDEAHCYVDDEADHFVYRIAESEQSDSISLDISVTKE